MSIQQMPCVPLCMCVHLKKQVLLSTSSSSTLLFKHFSKEITLYMHLNAFYVIEYRLHFSWAKHTQTPTQKEVTQLLTVSVLDIQNHHRCKQTTEAAHSIMMAPGFVTGSTATRENLDLRRHACCNTERHQSLQRCTAMCARAKVPQYVSFCPWHSLLNLTPAHPGQWSWWGPHGSHFEQIQIFVSF